MGLPFLDKNNLLENLTWFTIEIQCLFLIKYLLPRNTASRYLCHYRKSKVLFEIFLFFTVYT